MKTPAPHFLSSFWNLLLFVVGVVIGVYLIVVVDVELSLATLANTPPEHLPAMHPPLRYLFVPVIAAIVSLVMGLFNLLVNFFHPRRLHSLGGAARCVG
jgi:hypothetical protein